MTGRPGIGGHGDPDPGTRFFPPLNPHPPSKDSLLWVPSFFFGFSNIVTAEPHLSPRHQRGEPRCPRHSPALPSVRQKEFPRLMARASRTRFHAANSFDASAPSHSLARQILL